MIPGDDVPRGPFDRPQSIPASASIWNPANVPDGSSVQVDLATGELIHVPPSETRRLRLERRAKLHAERLEAERGEQAARNQRGAEAARAALPPKPTPIGLIRDRRTTPATSQTRKIDTGSAGQTA